MLSVGKVIGRSSKAVIGGVQKNIVGERIEWQNVIQAADIPTG